MRHFVALVSLTFTLIQLLPQPAYPARKPYVLDRSHCQINFIGEALLISAHGFFERWDADLQVDRDNLENSALTITIETASINTRITRRDDHLRSADFLDAPNHPQIKFVSTKIVKVDDKNLTITGDLTLRGVTKSLSVPVTVVFLREGDGRFKGDFQINRKDFGIKYNSMMNPVEDMVSIQFDFHIQDQERQKQRQQQVPPKPPAQ
jgi:polyisoprenoid-binding protein YceI